jgi:hypothetical protein
MSKWWLSFVGVGSDKDATCTRASAAPKRARSNREDYADQKLPLAARNNVGVERSRENIIRINGLCHMVRSEGGEDVRNFNNLQRWAKSQVHFPPIGAFQAKHQR